MLETLVAGLGDKDYAAREVLTWADLSLARSHYRKRDEIMQDSSGRLARRPLGAMIAVAALLAALAVVAAPALATPTGEYAVFAECPFSKVKEGACLYAKTESGKFIVGNETVPITNPIILQGGFNEAPDGEETFVGANTESNTLSKSPQKVPGGLLGLVKCNEITGEGFFEKELRNLCEKVFENKYTGVNATTELAAPASSIKLNEYALLLEEGTALSLPVKIHLENELLGSECYVGSNSSPIIIELTTGTTAPPPPNKPIKGKLGDPETNSEGSILTIKDNTLVNNSFSTPGASGCGPYGLLDSIVDAKLGVPSAAGHNTAELNGTLKQATASVVEEH